MPVERWQRIYSTNVLGCFVPIKTFLQAAKKEQEKTGKELENLSVVITSSECGKFGQAGHSEYASGKAGLQYGLVRSVKNEIVKLNSKARINAIAPGWTDTPLIKGRLDDPKEPWAEFQAAVLLRKITTPQDVARTMAFLSSYHAAGHILSECISVDVALSVDFDALSGWLGTGQHADNTLSDYSSGIFAGQVGVPRLLQLFKKHCVADKMTWFIPGHSMETFPLEITAIVEAGCEIALHGYCHEGAYQMTTSQERDVLAKCLELAWNLTGKKPSGYRAPLYQLRESTIALLEEHGFLYDSSLTHHDSQPYFAPSPTPPPSDTNSPSGPPNFSLPASTWMHPTPLPAPSSTLVEIPANWYMEDMTPLQFWPHTHNSHGYVDVRQMEQMWKDRFEWLWSNSEGEGENGGFIFPLVLHPDNSGMSHVIGMVERILV
ncbi:MAG: hypothetical protein M1834_006996 [Cirrosporium novae-zelandiae]|nr:MAG: hypothetical protein M1834_006996 [Cirrosporium novae-zelandiae]